MVVFFILLDRTKSNKNHKTLKFEFVLVSLEIPLGLDSRSPPSPFRVRLHEALRAPFGSGFTKPSEPLPGPASRSPPSPFRVRLHEALRAPSGSGFTKTSEPLPGPDSRRPPSPFRVRTHEDLRAPFGS